MAPFTTTLFSTFFLFSLLSVQIHARDSQFFSKFSKTKTPQDQNPNFIPETTQETVFPNKEEKLQYQDPSFVPESTQFPNKEEKFQEQNPSFVPEATQETTFPEKEEKFQYQNPNYVPETTQETSFTSKEENFQDQNPNFVPETTQETTFPRKEGKFQDQDPSFVPAGSGAGYGLYGHESLSNNYDEKASYEPYTTPTEELQSYEKRPKENYYNNDNYNDKDAYGRNRETGSYGDRRFTERGYSQDDVARNGKRDYYRAMERQGMSDTRFMENGKYYYDVNDETESNNRNRNYYSDRKYESYRPEKEQSEEFVDEEEDRRFRP